MLQAPESVSYSRFRLYYYISKPTFSTRRIVHTTGGADGRRVSTMKFHRVHTFYTLNLFRSLFTLLFLCGFTLVRLTINRSGTIAWRREDEISSVF